MIGVKLIEVETRLDNIRTQNCPWFISCLSVYIYSYHRPQHTHTMIDKHTQTARSIKISTSYTLLFKSAVMCEHFNKSSISQ